MTFERLGLSAEILRAVSEQNYHTPTPIQTKAIPVVLAGKDLMAAAQTGTGKTAGFTLPMLQRLSAAAPARGRRPVRALILTPTRELAAQVGESIDTYGKYVALRGAVIFGGVNINPQIRALRAGIDILTATPGRLLDHVGQGTLDLSKVEILVLDEADRMLDMGFIHDIKKVLALLPAKRQNLLFSATFSDDIKKLAGRLLDKPVSVEATPRNTTAERVEQLVHPVDRGRKRELLARLINDGDWSQVLVFTRTKHGANRLANQLERDGITSAAIHGNKSQNARTAALAGFKSGRIRALVATDIAARGLDIDKLPHVVNYELPNVPEDYVHRIGRTGRAGREGCAVSLVCVDEHKLLRDIERLLKTSVPQEVVAGFEPNPNEVAEPIPNGRNQASGGRGRRRPTGDGRGERAARGDRGERPARGERAERPARAERGARTENERGARGDSSRGGRSESARAGRTESPRGGRAERPARGAEGGRGGRTESGRAERGRSGGAGRGASAGQGRRSSGRSGGGTPFSDI